VCGEYQICTLEGGSLPVGQKPNIVYHQSMCARGLHALMNISLESLYYKDCRALFVAGYTAYSTTTHMMYGLQLPP
jgi:hypothetical protein